MRYQRGAVNLVLVVVLMALPVIGFLQRQNIYDWSKLRGYSPPDAVAQLASASSMNDRAKHIFYVNHPELVSNSSTFRGDCTTNEQTIVLGCYHPTQQGIFVYDVKDQRLSGIEEVTSAHEMLHAAYDRLSSGDKAKVNKMLEDFYKNDLKDQRILDTITAYKQSEPNDVVNEMHSIFGTEVANLPSALEDYYKRYFSNRGAVVAFSQKYETEFTSRSTKATQIETQLKALKTKIDAEEASLKIKSQQINTEQSRLDTLKVNNQIDQFNGGVGDYNASVTAYNSSYAQYKSDINNFNSLLQQYNAIAGELKQLYGALDTRLGPKAQ